MKICRYYVYQGHSVVIAWSLKYRTLFDAKRVFIVNKDEEKWC